jgi:hypothetical protein
MKRTNLVLDARLLDEALRVSGERTYSRAVHRALDDFVRGPAPDASWSWLAAASGKAAHQTCGPTGHGARHDGVALVLLVDTSVWVEVFRRPSPFDLPAVASLDEIVTCLPVIQEVLQGFQDEKAFRTAREAMLFLPCGRSAPSRGRCAKKPSRSTGPRGVRDERYGPASIA